MRLSGPIWLAIATGLVLVVSIVRVVLVKGHARRLQVGSVSAQSIAEHQVDSDVTNR